MAGMSLVMCLATVGLWARSYWRADILVYGHPDGWNDHVISTRGQMAISRVHATYPRPLGFSRHSNTPRRLTYNRWGFDWVHEKRVPHWGENVTEWKRVVFPHWCVVVLTAIAPGTLLPSVLRRLKYKHPGLCPSCGYDLRASPERCPECGRESNAIGTQRHRDSEELTERSI